MILPNMTFEEKFREIKSCYRPMIEFAQPWILKNNKQFLRTKTFPSCYTHELDLTSQGLGKWTLLFTIESRSLLRKNIVSIQMYQTYHVTHSKNPNNNGVGIYVLQSDDYSHVSCSKYTPHYFNRFRERFIEPKGITQPSFTDLVRRMACEHCWSCDMTIKGFRFKLDENGKYGLVEDHSDDRKEGYDNLVSYHKDGISLGVSGANRDYFLYMTYVPNSMLYPDQIKQQTENLKRARQDEFESRFNPFRKYKVDYTYTLRDSLKTC